ncbi:alpha-amylase family protein [Flavitalea flava]
MPNEVWIQSGDEWFKCVPFNQSSWKYKDVELLLKQADNALSVSVHSPTLPLNNIRLQWTHHIAASSKCLVDHWERTYGDVGWQVPAGNKKMPWYFIQHDDATANGFGVKTGANTICHWILGDKSLQLVLDTRNGGVGVQLGNRSLHAADIIITTSHNGESLFATTQRFCKMMCDKPILPRQPVYGINDWYFAYGNNSFQLILEHTNLLADLASDTNNIPFSVIDAGWAQYSPYLPNDGGWAEDFSRPNDKFKDMHAMAEGIKKIGMRPGLWTRALCGKHGEAKSLLLPAIPGRDNPKNPVLDPSIEENLERVRNNISLYKLWGYQLVKHDFTTYDILGKWGFEMTEEITAKGWRFNDNTKTTAEITLALYKNIREAAGDMYIIGCNTFGHEDGLSA